MMAMTKKLLIAAVIIIIILAISVIVGFYITNHSNPSPEVSATPTPTIGPIQSLPISTCQIPKYLWFQQTQAMAIILVPQLLALPMRVVILEQHNMENLALP